MWLFSKELAIPIQRQACACLINHPQYWQPSWQARQGDGELSKQGFCAGMGASRLRGSVAAGWHGEACAEPLRDAPVCL